MKLPGILDLHRELVSCPSVSKDEGPIADLVEDLLRKAGASVERVGNNVVATGGSGPSILLNSHLDTVPAQEAWTRDPWKWAQEGERIYGLGSNDAKAAVACMMIAFESILQRGGPVQATLLLVPEEETGGGGMQVIWPELCSRGQAPPVAVIGEPTGLDLAVAQKGLLILELIARGDACHSANANALKAINPIGGLARSLVALDKVDLGPEHGVLGATTMQPTVLSGGTARNMVPEVASAYLDLRTHPEMSHGELIRRVEQQVECEVRVHSNRFHPKGTDPDSAIVQAAKLARPGAMVYGSRTLSDWAYIDVPAVKVGPGRTERSHTPDEFVLESELKDGVDFYRQLIERYSETACQDQPSGAKTNV